MSDDSIELLPETSGIPHQYFDGDDSFSYDVLEQFRTQPEGYGDMKKLDIELKEQFKTQPEGYDDMKQLDLKLNQISPLANAGYEKVDEDSIRNL